MKSILTQAEKESEEAIRQAAGTFKTEAERDESLATTIKQQQQSEQKEIETEMKQLKAGEFDRLLSGGQAPVPESKPIEKTEVKAELKAGTKAEEKVKEEVKPKD